MIPEICVIDFNPVVHEKLKQRDVYTVYGDITARDVLHHAGASHAEIIICSLPNMVLKGANNLKILRQLRELNPHAQIIVHAEVLADVPALYAAGANYVSAPRLLEAADLLHVLESAEKKPLDHKRSDQEHYWKTAAKSSPKLFDEIRLARIPALTTAIKAARAAGQVMHANWHKPKHVNRAEGHDIKLELDVRCQALIEKILRAAFPQIPAARRGR